MPNDGDYAILVIVSCADLVVRYINRFNFFLNSYFLICGANNYGKRIKILHGRPFEG